MQLPKCLFLLIAASACSNCSKSGSTGNNGGNNPPGQDSKDTINVWLTRADATVLLQQQTAITFNASSNNYSTVTVDSTTAYQTIDGFGYTLTGGSAQVINTLDADTKNNLLQELFGNNDNSIGVSYLRISIGASDLNASVFSYDDVAGDTALTHFSLAPDETDLIPLLKQVIAINPDIKIVATPWSAPAWMKDNNNSIGGSLLPQYYNVYANYFVKYIQAMKAVGIIIDAITPQNEPLNPGNNPSMLMTAEDQKTFIKNNLGPAFVRAGITTKIIVYDHNCDLPDYPTTILNDANAAKYIDGSAFHLYAGDISALSNVHNSFPDKHVYFTEQYTSSTGQFAGDFLWHIKNVVIGSVNNWSRNALEWNLANDASFGPHTPGGCTECKGALTIQGSVAKNVSYYIIAQISKFVPPGSVRIKTNVAGGLYNVAFKTPQGKKILLVLNDGSSPVNFNIQFKDKTATATLPARSAATYVW
ncbi:MAG TPA: glycoside hydrolase family 30 beta sandwich domain-containing protein [Parafilimonas sp.]|nr:glycoside hydrolase family 30 beta sandwich domain-containing protein [Parafilimonas sp.]